MFEMAFDPTVTFGHVLTIVSFVVSFVLAAIFWQIRLVVVEHALADTRLRMEAIEDARIEREKELVRRLERIEDKIDGKVDKPS